jgi:hypothetical protein
MAKFKVSLKLEKFELDIEGSHEDMPLIADRVGRQFAGMLVPSAEIIAGDALPEQNKVAHTVIAPAVTDDKRKSARGRRPRATATVSANGAENTSAAALTWRHDTERWGTPKQVWTVGKKIIYLLYVAKQEVNQTEMTGLSVVETFNKHFMSAGMLRTKHIRQELDKLKNRVPAPVSENVTKEPSTWFLTQQGDKEAAALINDALGRVAGAASASADVSGAGATA